ncbi:hypothetical protein F5144DRAFT_595288 [Chaetomium tenue]|uniref:Uncharacterized protein n=1 Tax=Chaetomium tenue TaxID=1854479 RepID=A0ACB7NXC1_9PEZI|nr:hypothetical protein F5144DRAFT_595288 [Chaetomium globosum]
MAGPPSPGSDGPTFGPPPLPAGWIAQWDASSKKYYFVQLSTGASQWDTPTEAAPVGGTPAARSDHPYGVPHGANNGAEIIVHPDGSRTARYPDGRLEPVHPREDDYTSGARGVGGGDGDRGLGSFLGNTLSSLGGKQGGGSHGGGGVGGVAGQLVSGLLSSGGSGGGHSSGGGGGIGGKLASQLASNLFSSGKPSSQPQNYHGGQSSGHSSGGGLGGIVGGVANMFGGKPHGSVRFKTLKCHHKMLTARQGQSNFGYSNNGQTGGYSASAPPTSYQPPSQPGTTPSHHSGASSYQSSGQHHAPSSQYTSSYSTSGPSSHTQSYGASPHGQSQSYGPPSYGAPPAVPGAYGQHSQPHYSQPQYSSGGSGGGHSGYPPQPQYASGGHHQGYGGSGQYH